MFETLFQALFTYRPVVFQQGEFRFDVTGASLTAAALAGDRHGRRGRHLPRRPAQGPPARPGRPDRAADAGRWRSSSSACSGRRSSCAPRCRSRTSSPCCSTIRAACRFPTGAASRAASSSASSSARPTARCMKALSDRFLVRTFRFSSTAEPHRVRGRPDVQRLADAARRRRSTARARNWPGCRCPASCSCPTAPTRATWRSATPCSA